MADPLSVTASIITLVGAVISTIDTIKSGHSAWKNQLDDLHLELHDLKSMLDELRKQSNQVPNKDAVEGAEKLLIRIHESVVYAEMSTRSNTWRNVGKLQFRSKINAYIKWLRDAKTSLVDTCSVATWYFCFQGSILKWRLTIHLGPYKFLHKHRLSKSLKQ